jgi:hypothetical protein
MFGYMEQQSGWEWSCGKGAPLNHARSSIPETLKFPDRAKL